MTVRVPDSTVETLPDTGVSSKVAPCWATRGAKLRTVAGATVLVSQTTRTRLNTNDQAVVSQICCRHGRVVGQ